MKRKLSFSPAKQDADRDAATPRPKVELSSDAVSDEEHTDRQWSKMMLHNLHYCANTAKKRNSSLEQEWKNLYPCSSLTPRNLKSRFTVYERTRGVQPPKYPMYYGNKKPKKPPPSPSKQPLEPVLIPILPQKTRVQLPSSAWTSADIDNTGPLSPSERYASQPPTATLVSGSTIKKGPIQEKENTLGAGGVGKPLQYVCKERPVEYADLPRSKWICDYHYIHLFYDDENKSYECILTDQLLQIRHTLVHHFPGQDLYKSGKKPTGFAPLLLHHWKLHYPATEENTKTISMKIGKYDRAIQILTQKPVSAEGKINWTPNMIENIRITRERALVRMSGRGGDVTPFWKEEWNEIYPDMDLSSSWRHIISRYQYHFGAAEQREEQDFTAESLPRERFEMARKRMRVESRDGSEDYEVSHVKGLRIWNLSMQEDLLILKDLIFEEYPDIEQGSQEFAEKLLQAFKLRHPTCLESARSLLARLKDPITPIKDSPPPEDRILPAPAAKTHIARSSVTAGIQGFTDWNLAMLKDFISCMDKTRKKYAVLKQNDPNLKLVPLLLEEWMKVYPTSKESVRSFLQRIRHLKTNKEKIKQYLNDNHTLVKQEEEEEEMMKVKLEADDDIEIKQEEPDNKFSWNSATMMPHVISTRSKAVEIQARDLRHGRKTSYSKIWIREFKKIYPNCPYTANNLSVHYFYWNNKESGGRLSSASDSRSSSPGPVIYMNQDWTEDKLHTLLSLGLQINQRDVNPGKFKSQLRSAWLKSGAGGNESAEELAILFNKIKDAKTGAEDQTLFSKKDLPWSPKLNKELRELVSDLQSANEYTTKHLFIRWRKLHKGYREDSLQFLINKLEDNSMKLPLVEIVTKSSTPATINQQIDEEIKEEVKTKPANWVLDPKKPYYLNGRGQMRWSPEAISHLIACHKLAAQSKNSLYNQKLADVLHSQFKKKFPLCPVGPNVLLTKCYIFRSEIKNGKLTLQENPDLDTGRPSSQSANSLCGRTWTEEMLAELEPSRQRAVQRKRKIQFTSREKCPLIGDLWIEEFRKKFPNYKSSKKTMMKKYKECKKRKEAESDVIPVIPNNILLELKGLLENKEVILPPEIPASLYNVVEQWAFNHCIQPKQQTEQNVEHKHDNEQGKDENLRMEISNFDKLLQDDVKNKHFSVSPTETNHINTQQQPNDELLEIKEEDPPCDNLVSGEAELRQDADIKVEDDLQFNSLSQDLNEDTRWLQNSVPQTNLQPSVSGEDTTTTTTDDLDIIKNGQIIANQRDNQLSVEKVQQVFLPDSSQEVKKEDINNMQQNKQDTSIENSELYIKINSLQQDDDKWSQPVQTSLVAPPTSEHMETTLVVAPTSQPVQTTLADGTNIMTFTTVEEPGARGNSEAAGESAGHASTETQVNYLMCGAPENATQQLLDKLKSIGLQIESLFLAMKCYSNTRAEFEGILHAGYLASWSKLVLARWEEDGLPKMKFDDIEEVMSILLDDSGLRLENRTVDRAGANITKPWSEDRINMILKMGIQHRSDLKTGYNKLMDRCFNINMKEFISLLIILGVINRQMAPEELDVELELIDTWHCMNMSSATITTEDTSQEETKMKVIQMPKSGSSLHQVGNWARRTKKLPVVRRISGILPRITVTPDLTHDLATTKVSVLQRWWKLPRHKRLGKSIGASIKARTKHLHVRQQMIVGLVNKLSLRKRDKISKQEKDDISQMNQEYEDNLNTYFEADVNDQDDEVEIIEEQLPDEFDYTLEQNVLSLMRKQKKRVFKSGWNADNIVLLLKARDEAIAIKQRLARSHSPHKQRNLTQLLVERWCALKPSQQNINPVNLVMALHKFKEYQQQLILEQDKTIRLKERAEYNQHSPYPGSGGLRGSRNSSTESVILYSPGPKMPKRGSRIPVILNTSDNEADTKTHAKYPIVDRWLHDLNVDTDTDDGDSLSDQVGYVNLDVLATDNLQTIETEITKAIEDSQAKIVDHKIVASTNKDVDNVKLIDDRHECPDCLALFHNVNNYQLHRNLHFTVPIHGPRADGRQRLRWAGYVENRGREYYDYSFYVCAELVDQLVDTLPLPTQISSI